MPYLDKIRVDGQDYDIGNNIEETLPVGTRVEFNGQAQNIPDGWQQVEDEGEVYSTTERRIGTWIDGKPLYQITKVFSNSGTGDKYFNSNLSDIDKLFFLLGYAQSDSGINFNLPFINSANVSAYNIEIQDLTSSGQLKVHIGTAWTGTINPSTFYITFRYTKTTDTVGGEE